MFKAALLGNPNTGKTSLFNTLTDSYEYVGNWSGVTVDKKVGSLSNKKGELIDLPGLYDLNPLSEDESVVTRFLMEDHVDTLLNIVDASQLERNLQLTLQVLEYGKPVVIGLNMVDVAKRKGLEINVHNLSELLTVPVVGVVARSGKGCDALLNQLQQNNYNQQFKIDYGAETENAIAALSILVPETVTVNKRWLSIQLLSKNEVVEKYFKSCSSKEMISQIVEKLEKQLQCPSERHIYNTRKKLIESITKETTIYHSKGSLNGTELIDKFATHRFLGLPIFFILMFLIFQLTFTWIGSPLSDVLDSFLTGPVIETVTNILNNLGASQFITDLITDGVITGVGGVLVFVPQIFVLFFCISLLEDSGYMSRIAVVMDRMMEYFGLNGKAFIPMIISFGCNVPGIMAARTIEQKKERLMTILVAPFMSCSARLPVYALFVGAFFVKNQAIIVFSMYLLGIILALLVTKILSVTFLKKEQSVYVIELPPYRIPQWKTLWRSTWEKGKGFIRKAGTVIFAGSVMIWLLSYIGPNGFEVPMDESYLAMVGGFIAPVFIPLGFGTWQAASALITGFLAKEVVVSSMSIIYGVGEAQLSGHLTTFFTPLTGYVFMVFILLYVPCLATVAVIKRETGSLKWTIFSIVYPLLTAYGVAFIIYEIGKMLGFS